MMVHRRLYNIFVILIFVATVRGLNITRCLGPYNDSYTCPGLSDTPERTHCCLWDGQPACCLPGGSSCSDNNANKRNYCPGPNDGTERTQCCIWKSQPACCLPEGSSCFDNADIRNYCPGPDEGNDRTHCCVWDGLPTCCFPGGSSCSDNARNYCPGPSHGKNYRFCAVNDRGETEFCSPSKFLLYLGWFIAAVLVFAVGVTYLGCKCCARYR